MEGMREYFALIVLPEVAGSDQPLEDRARLTLTRFIDEEQHLGHLVPAAVGYLAVTYRDGKCDIDVFTFDTRADPTWVVPGRAVGHITYYDWAALCRRERSSPSLSAHLRGISAPAEEGVVYRAIVVPGSELAVGLATLLTSGTLEHGDLKTEVAIVLNRAA